MQNVVKKAVIPAAGLGTRFLPATKAVPKELLPIVDIPTVHLIVQEIVKSGIKEVIFVTGRGKSSIIDHFDVHPALERKLADEGKEDLLEMVRETSSMARVFSVRQQEPKGLGHAVLCAKELVGNEPFAVLLGDDLVDAVTPCTKQMTDVFEKHNKSVVGLLRVPNDDVSKFGIVGGTEVEDRIYELDTMIEKPSLEDAPSNLSIVGRYILKPKIFEYLENAKPGKNGEIQLTDAMAQMMKDDGFIGYEFIGKRYDAGDKFGFLQASISYALKRRDIAPKLMKFMKEIVERGE